jgi:cytochrome b
MHMTGANPKKRRWDPIVKMTHWGIVAAIIGNGLITGEGSGSHIWVGYALAGLLGLRLLWGFVGPAEARFSAFPPSPKRAFKHLAEIKRGEVTTHRSHNPLGTFMVYAIWLCLGAIIASGIAMSGPPPANPLAARGEQSEATYSAARTEAGEDEEDEGGKEEGGEAGEEFLEEVHEIAVNLLYALILLHLAGVVFETRRSGKAVLGAMIPGGNRLSNE